MHVIEATDKRYTLILKSAINSLNLYKLHIHCSFPYVYKIKKNWIRVGISVDNMCVAMEFNFVNNDYPLTNCSDSTKFRIYDISKVSEIKITIN